MYVWWKPCLLVCCGKGWIYRVCLRLITVVFCMKKRPKNPPVQGSQSQPVVFAVIKDSTFCLDASLQSVASSFERKYENDWEVKTFFLCRHIFLEYNVQNNRKKKTIQHSFMKNIPFVFIFSRKHRRVSKTLLKSHSHPEANTYINVCDGNISFFPCTNPFLLTFLLIGTKNNTSHYKRLGSIDCLEQF